MNEGFSEVSKEMEKDDEGRIHNDSLTGPISEIETPLNNIKQEKTSIFTKLKSATWKESHNSILEQFEQKLPMKPLDDDDDDYSLSTTSSFSSSSSSPSTYSRSRRIRRRSRPLDDEFDYALFDQDFSQDYELPGRRLAGRP
eukprot:CAMPEP_0117422242 /NCGR_PEP_ID=MMETSP0758-20121206/3124_1 /TAXON_ID=63605 /ORGANISM="Percolomonas cosmopolitus, Strain AE-1 (ATCC 50343)" /LENGTH=141 /DNA_ID=CAMNT_0005204751 /DNA_START=28 /DNA_END=450 /DNA_ORIENTATION=-